MEYTVSRNATAFVTVHEGTDTTARAAATDELAARLEALVEEGRLGTAAVDDADVYEHPAGPFEPYAVRVSFTVSVAVDATDESAAERAGSAAIEDELAAAEFDGLEYVGDAELSSS